MKTTKFAFIALAMISSAGAHEEDCIYRGSDDYMAYGEFYFGETHYRLSQWWRRVSGQETEDRLQTALYKIAQLEAELRKHKATPNAKLIELQILLYHREIAEIEALANDVNLSAPFLYHERSRSHVTPVEYVFLEEKYHCERLFNEAECKSSKEFLQQLLKLVKAQVAKKAAAQAQ